MKRLLFVFLLFPGTYLSAQQKKFLDIPTYGKPMTVPVFNQSFDEIFEPPASWKSISIEVDELSKASHFDFSKLENLELVQIEFTFRPDTSDAAKKIFIDSVNVLMKNMSCFAKCPKLQKVVFHIGEQIYLTKEETDGDDYSEKVRAWEFRQNLTKAWTAFGQDVSTLLPGVKLYAYNWGW